MGIDLTKEPEKDETIQVNYPKLPVSGINSNNGDFISGTYFNNSSTQNITYTKKSLKNTYKAKELRIYGRLFPGVSLNYNATLVIKNSKYPICGLLILFSKANSGVNDSKQICNWSLIIKISHELRVGTTSSSFSKTVTSLLFICIDREPEFTISIEKRSGINSSLKVILDAKLSKM